MIRSHQIGLGFLNDGVGNQGRRLLDARLLVDRARAVGASHCVAQLGRVPSNGLPQFALASSGC